MANYQYINDTGIIVADTYDLRLVVESEYKAVFGQDLDVSNDTPQGRLIDAETLARRATIQAMASIANQINPNYSRGPFLDALCSFLDLERGKRTSSRVNGVRLTGIPDAIVPAGSIARDQNGVAWRSVANSQFDQDGMATADFLCTETGPVPCQPGELSRVSVSVIGWETVSNPNAAVLGSRRQSDASLRTLRENTLGRLGISTTLAITSRLYDSPVNARSATYRENITDQTMTIDGITIGPHTLWTCVQGGSDMDIAEALLEAKTIGANWKGDVEVTVTDRESGQPYPVRFDRPTEVPIDFMVTVKQGSFTGNAQNATIDALLAYAAGQVPEYDGFVLRDNDVSPATVAGAIQCQLAGLTVYNIQAKRSSDSDYQAAPIELAIQEVATVSRGNITVRVRT